MDLWHIPAIDQHAHNLLRPEVAARTPFQAAFTEGAGPVILDDHARHTLFYRRSLRDIGQLLGCGPSEEDILARRAELGLEQLARMCFDAANLEAILLDDGFLPEQVLPLSWHEPFVRVHRLLRLEWLAEELLGSADTFEAFVDQFRAALDPPPANVVGLKSIAAYRTGLDIQRLSLELASRAWREWKQATGEGNRPRLAKKHLLDFLLRQAMELAARHRLPVQFHTGLGDPDLDLRLANPLHLRRLLEDARFRTVPVVLLHAAYPFTREAGYLASVYPQVYVDMGLSVPFLSVSGMRTAVRMLLELAPFTKVMYASDAHLIPELYYLGAKWGRQVLGACLEEAIADGDLTSNEAEEVAIAVLQDNARRLYRLETG